MIQWREARKTPLFELDIFREQLGLGVDDYKRMSDFKRRVLEASVKEINDKTDINISYKQEKKGTTIVGFKFKVLLKDTKSKNIGNIILFQFCEKYLKMKLFLKNPNTF